MDIIYIFRWIKHKTRLGLRPRFTLIYVSTAPGGEFLPYFDLDKTPLVRESSSVPLMKFIIKV